MKKACVVGVWLAVSALLPLVSVASDVSGEASVAKKSYAPGLGEIMTATQMRHIKLWFAGQAGNWKLANYEVDELEEGFEDAINFHPQRTELLEKVVELPLKQMRRAIAEKSANKFRAAFGALTDSCNECHKSENFGFNVVVTPTSNPYTNQVFTTLP